jgi:hypothetical protein
MASNQDWIPHGVKEFDDFQKTFIDLTETNETDWGLDHDKRVALKALGTTYSDYYTISKNAASASQLDYENTHNARILYIKGIRVFTKEEIRYILDVTKATAIRTFITPRLIAGLRNYFPSGFSHILSFEL